MCAPHRGDPPHHRSDGRGCGLDLGQKVLWQSEFGKATSPPLFHLQAIEAVFGYLLVLTFQRRGKMYIFKVQRNNGVLGYKHALVLGADTPSSSLDFSGIPALSTPLRLSQCGQQPAPSWLCPRATKVLTCLSCSPAWPASPTCLSHRQQSPHLHLHPCSAAG